MNNRIRAILVDDEAGARESLRELLARFCPEVEVADEAANVAEAVRSVKSHRPDVVFLDIEMPGQSGFELIGAFHTVTFHVIFVTAYDRYALKAFEVSAIDYLLKPVDTDRLREAVQKVAAKQEQQHYKSRFEAFRTNTRSDTLKKLAIPQKGDYDIVDIEDIITIEAERMYSRLSVSDSRTQTVKPYTYSKKLSYFESLFEQLPDFHRVHRSWIVNTRHMTSYSRKDHSLMLKNNAEVPVSKSYRSAFEDFLGF